MKEEVITKSRIMALAIAVIFIVSSLVIVGVAVTPARATITGDAYSGSGDWAVNNPTTYTGETLTVYGNITISDSGSLTLTSTVLTLDQTSDFARKIYVHGNPGSPFLKVQTGSTIQTTNATPGHWNAYVRCDGYSTNQAYFQIDNSTVRNFNFDLSSMGRSRINNSTLYASGSWVYNMGSAIDAGPLTVYGSTFRDTNTSGAVISKSILDLANSCSVSHSTFLMNNITLNTTISSISSVIRVASQEDVLITDNQFAGQSLYQGIFVWGDADTNPVRNCLIMNNVFGIWGSDFAHRSYAIQAVETAENCVIAYNTFQDIRNGSRAIHVMSDGWRVTGNVIDHVDASNLAGYNSQSVGVYIGHFFDEWDMAGMVIEDNVINSIMGPGIDNGSSAFGIMSKGAYNFTVDHTVATDIAGVACPIGVVDNLYSGNTHPNILIHANTITNVTRASNGIVIFGGNGVIAQWNNISGVDGSCAGIMTDSTAIAPLIRNNSVTDMFYADNIWPDWQITVGAYAHYSYNSSQAPRWIDNHAEGATIIHPAYDLCGEYLGGGWSSTARMLVDTPEDTIIRILNGNLTLVHASQVYQVLEDGSPLSMRWYSNGTSWAYYSTYGNHSYHWFNVTLIPMSIDPVAPVDIAVSNWSTNRSGSRQWTANSDVPDSVTTYAITGLENFTQYDITVDGALWRTVVSNGSGAISFTYSATAGEHEFVVGLGYMQKLMDFTYSFLAIAIVVAVIMMAIGLVVGVGNSKRV